MATVKTFKDVPKSDMVKLKKLFQSSFNEIYKTTSERDALVLTYKIYHDFKNKILLSIKQNRKFFQSRFIDTIKNDDYEFQAFVNQNVKERLKSK